MHPLTIPSPLINAATAAAAAEVAPVPAQPLAAAGVSARRSASALSVNVDGVALRDAVWAARFAPCDIPELNAILIRAEAGQLMVSSTDAEHWATVWVNGAAVLQDGVAVVDGARLSAALEELAGAAIVELRGSVSGGRLTLRSERGGFELRTQPVGTFIDAPEFEPSEATVVPADRFASALNSVRHAIGGDGHVSRARCCMTMAEAVAVHASDGRCSATAWVEGAPEAVFGDAPKLSFGLAAPVVARLRRLAARGDVLFAEGPMHCQIAGHNWLICTQRYVDISDPDLAPPIERDPGWMAAAPRADVIAALRGVLRVIGEDELATVQCTFDIDGGFHFSGEMADAWFDFPLNEREGRSPLAWVDARALLAAVMAPRHAKWVVFTGDVDGARLFVSFAHQPGSTCVPPVCTLPAA